MNKKIITIIIVILILISSVAIGFFYYVRENIEKPYVEENYNVDSEINLEQPVSIAGEPIKIEYGKEFPADFPANIPYENEATINQSYSLDYSGKKQLTIVFQSEKTVKQNYEIYSDFLKKDGWNIVNKYESKELTSLYGAKESNEINVTISLDNVSKKVQVSISVLNK